MSIWVPASRTKVETYGIWGSPAIRSAIGKIDPRLASMHSLRIIEAANGKMLARWVVQTARGTFNDCSNMLCERFNRSSCCFSLCPWVWWDASHSLVRFLPTWTARRSQELIASCDRCQFICLSVSFWHHSWIQRLVKLRMCSSSASNEILRWVAGM